MEAIHPKLYHKNTIFIGKIAKQLLKGTLKIDLDDDKKDDSLNLKIPDFKPEDLLNTKDYILIFDDLERCSINIINLLGYINFFVEHQSYKVILIANEKELKKTKKYKTIKEKLIGKTFEFKTNSSLAYDSFLIELKNENRVKENILEKARKMDFPFKCARLDRSQKSPYFVDLRDLSNILDRLFHKDSPYIDTNIVHTLKSPKE